MNHHDIQLIQHGERRGYDKAVREIVAWLRDDEDPYPDSYDIADEIEAKFGGGNGTKD